MAEAPRTAPQRTDGETDPSPGLAIPPHDQGPFRAAAGHVATDRACETALWTPNPRTAAAYGAAR